MGKPEGRVEDYFVKSAKHNGFMYFKFTAPSTNGVPDRIIIGHGMTIFVELKAPGKKPRKLQVITMDEMREHGARVYVIDTIQAVDELFQSLLNDAGHICTKEPPEAARRLPMPQKK